MIFGKFIKFLTVITKVLLFVSSLEKKFAISKLLTNTLGRIKSLNSLLKQI